MNKIELNADDGTVKLDQREAREVFVVSVTVISEMNFLKLYALGLSSPEYRLRDDGLSDFRVCF